MRGTFGLFSIDALTIRKSSLQNMEYFFQNPFKASSGHRIFIPTLLLSESVSGNFDKAVAVRGVHENNRITKVDSREVKPASTRVVLWKEVNQWAENENTIPEDIKLHIKRVYRSFQIANAPLLKKWG